MKMSRHEKNKVKKLIGIILITGILLAAGCSAVQNKEEKIKDLEFTVLGEDAIPEETKVMIEEKKEQPFKFTFADEGYLYICTGYGKQKTGGYSITVDSVYLTDNAIYVDTNLLGPTDEDADKESPSYPCVVIKMEYIEKSVVFE